MTLKQKFAIAVLGVTVLAGFGAIEAKHWAEDTYGKDTVHDAVKSLWQDHQYAAAIRANMTPARHDIYEQVMHSASEGPNGISCFTIPAGTSDADAKGVTKIIQAQMVVAEDTRYVISRGAPAPGCKPPHIPR